jgi:hypothetical protein
LLVQISGPAMPKKHNFSDHGMVFAYLSATR